MTCGRAVVLLEKPLCRLQLSGQLIDAKFQSLARVEKGAVVLRALLALLGHLG